MGRAWLSRLHLAAILLAGGAAAAGAGEFERMEQADRRLNRDYRALIERLGADEEAAAALKAAQRAWIAFRDAECRFQAMSTEGGTIHSRIVVGCLADLTEARVAELQSYLACEEGDLACPTAQ